MRTCERAGATVPSVSTQTFRASVISERLRVTLTGLRACSGAPLMTAPVTRSSNTTPSAAPFLGGSGSDVHTDVIARLRASLLQHSRSWHCSMPARWNTDRSGRELGGPPKLAAESRGGLRRLCSLRLACCSAPSGRLSNSPSCRSSFRSPSFPFSCFSFG